MPEEERSRWTEKVDHSTNASCSTLLLLLFLISLPLGKLWAADFKAIKAAFVSLPTLLCVAMEALIHRVKRPTPAPAMALPTRKYS